MSAAQGDGRLAPVIPLFDDASGRRSWHSTWDDDGDDDTSLDEYDDEGAVGEDDGSAIERELAERALLKRLRTRQLSEKEACGVLAERSLDSVQIDAVIAAFRARGYLDDSRLAEQLIHIGVDRKGQGRRAIAITLSQRGIPRTVAEAALRSLPDDDAERALEFARHKASAMRGLEREVALRRLVGQLARRGHPAAVDVARRALDEVAGRPS